MSQKSHNPRETPRILNRKARHDYHILESLEVGIMLRGTEVKAIRQGRCSIGEAFARVEPATGELWLYNMDVSMYDHAAAEAQHLPKEKRKLLARRNQIDRLLGLTTERGHTLVPLSLYFNERGIAKIELAVAEGKSRGDKRESLKKEETARSIRKAMTRRRIG